MTEIDRGADRSISTFAAQIDGIERSFDHDDLVPLRDGEAARRADAALVRSEVLSSGTGFVELVYSQQWVRRRRVDLRIEAYPARRNTEPHLDSKCVPHAASLR